jgi:hypothetical protein
MAQTQTLDAGRTSPQVRIVAEPRPGLHERMWGELIRPRLARVLSISHWSTLSYGDVVKVSPLCSCGESHDLYQAGARVFRASRRVQAFTRGMGARRMREIVAYLEQWPAVAGYSNWALSTPGYVGCDIMPDGFPAGVAAYGECNRREMDTHWRIAFPWSTPRSRAREFLDQLPYVEWHELRPDAEGRSTGRRPAGKEPPS